MSEPIELLIAKRDIGVFVRILDDIFNENSPDFPVRVYSRYFKADDSLNAKPVKIPDWYTIAEDQVNNTSERIRNLAEIRINGHPSYFVISITGEIGQERDWDKVLKITKSIIDRFVFFNGKIIYGKPLELMPTKTSSGEEIADNKLGSPDNISQSLDKPWEKIPDHYADRQIVELWHKGFTNSEIGDKVGLAPRTVTNRLSKLRKEYGEDIVPTDEQRRKKLLKN
jgi:DNA-binding CsgD family transcriptional regulator